MPQTVRKAGSINVLKKNIKSHLLIECYTHINILFGFKHLSICLSSHHSGRLVPTLLDINRAMRLHMQGMLFGHLFPSHVFPDRLCKVWVPDGYFALIVAINMLFANAF